jgi:hypothetical protein
MRPRIVGTVPGDLVERLAGQLDGLTTTERVVRALDGLGTLDDAVWQDEFTVDLVVRAGPVWVVFDTT